jgi:hypothetical protein
MSIAKLAITPRPLSSVAKQISEQYGDANLDIILTYFLQMLLISYSTSFTVTQMT